MRASPFEKIAIDDLRLFAAVAEELSFRGAARRLGVPVATVSRRVADLEQAIGVRLLQRTSREVGLTADGARLVERAAPALEELRVAVEGALEDDDAPAGKLRVTAPVMTGGQRIAPALFEFAKAYPRVRLELVLTNAIVAMIDEGFDLAFRAGPIADPELVARKLWALPLVLAASPAFVESSLGGNTTVAFEDLARLDAVMLGPQTTWRLVREDGATELVRPTPRLFVNDPRVSVTAAADGLGVVAAPAEALAAFGPRLVALEVPGYKMGPYDLYAVYPSKKLLPARVRLAIEWVAERAPRPAPVVNARGRARPARRP